MATNDPGQPPLSRAVPSDATVGGITPRVALAIGAHPDDVEFGAGGTLARWAGEDCVVHHLVCTDGSKGTWNPDADIAALIARRRDEQIEAARRLAGPNAGEVIFLGRTDGDLENDVPTRAAVVAAIRRLRPDVVLGHDPWKRYRLHPDHRAAGLLTCDAIVGARDPTFFRELDLAPHRPATLLLFEADEANHVEDVATGLEAKLDALLAHESQFESTMHASADNADELAAFRSRIVDRLAELGAPFGLAAAEVFARLDDL